jgi:hypothetical protein
MKKLLIVAALVATSFAAPVAPVSAATTAAAKSSLDCLIFPIFKKECWEKGAAAVSAAPKAAAVTVHQMKLPFMWWDCKPAAAGSGHMLDC